MFFYEEEYAHSTYHTVLRKCCLIRISLCIRRLVLCHSILTCLWNVHLIRLFVYSWVRFRLFVLYGFVVGRILRMFRQVFRSRLFLEIRLCLLVFRVWIRRSSVFLGILWWIVLLLRRLLFLWVVSHGNIRGLVVSFLVLCCLLVLFLWTASCFLGIVCVHLVFS